MPESLGGDGRSVVLTVGHSNGPFVRLVALLEEFGVEVLVDTRSHPYSRVAPHFSRHSIEGGLRKARIGYLFMGDALGGRPPQRECYVDGKVDYDRVEEQDFYQQGVARLMEVIEASRVCILCAEEDPVECHRRRLVGRTLLGRGLDVLHIRGDGTLEDETSVQTRFERDHPLTRQLAFGFGEL